MNNTAKSVYMTFCQIFQQKACMLTLKAVVCSVGRHFLHDMHIGLPFPFRVVLNLP